MAKVTSAELAQDVDGAERLILRHGEFKAEINSRQDSLNRFYGTGNSLIEQVLTYSPHRHPSTERLWTRHECGISRNLYR